MKEYLTPMGPTPLHVNPIFEIGPVEPRFSEWLVFEGISVDESGRQHFLDATVATNEPYSMPSDYFSKFGYSKEQVQHLFPYHRINDSYKSFTHTHRWTHPNRYIYIYIDGK